MAKKTRLTDLPEEVHSPLNAAVAGRDEAVLDMVAAAIRHREVMLSFQPIRQARGSCAVAFYEGLIRVLDATGRVIPARDFMPAVEDTELGRELDRIALDAGLRVLEDNPSVRLSLNMSARSIGFSAWNRTLERHLNAGSAACTRLMLEISEASAMSVPEIAVNFMDRLAPLGIAFALDDFGGGQTVFRHFRDFCFDAVKIDARYMRGLHANPGNQAVVRALIAVARAFEMKVFAPSVETEADAEVLIAAGVDCLQGYLIGAPTVHPPWAEGQARRSA